MIDGRVLPLLNFQCWSRLLEIEILGWCPVLCHGGEGASLALVGDTSSGGVTIKTPYGVDVLQWPASHPIFSYGVG